jgi:hypothetical protein
MGCPTVSAWSRIVLLANLLACRRPGAARCRPSGGWPPAPGLPQAALAAHLLLGDAIGCRRAGRAAAARRKLGMGGGRQVWLGPRSSILGHPGAASLPGPASAALSDGSPVSKAPPFGSRPSTDGPSPGALVPLSRFCPGTLFPRGTSPVVSHCPIPFRGGTRAIRSAGRLHSVAFASHRCTVDLPTFNSFSISRRESPACDSSRACCTLIAPSSRTVHCCRPCASVVSQAS